MQFENMQFTFEQCGGEGCRCSVCLRKLCVTLQSTFHIQGSAPMDCSTVAHIQSKKKKKSACKWTCAVETHVVQGSTVTNSDL